MRAFMCTTRTSLATVTSVLAAPGVSQANGGHIHFGTANIPLGVIYGVGGFVATVVLLFVANWVRYRRSQLRGDLSPRPQRSLRDDEEEEDVT
jgi:hypothetical protein